MSAEDPGQNYYFFQNGEWWPVPKPTDNIGMRQAGFSVTETDVNVLAQRFYEASGLTLSHGHDKPKVVAGLTAVLAELGIEVTA